MDQTRRDLLKAGATSAALAVLPRPLVAQPLLAHVRGVPEPVPPVTDPDVKELALRAIDAAKRAGATYADVRLTYSKRRNFTALLASYLNPRGTLDEESLQVGVRALVNGCWGFASSTLWAKDEMDRLGRQATVLAKAIAAAGKERAVELAPTPAVHDGHWATPLEIDPFEISPYEVVDRIRSLTAFFDNMKLPYVGCEIMYEAIAQERAFASSDGSYCTQRLQRGFPFVRFSASEMAERGMLQFYDIHDRFPTATGLGFEVFNDQPAREYLAERADAVLAELSLPLTSLDVGRYDTVCDARTVATLVDSTLSAATQLDRALGYEANASGTSYMNDPLGMLGIYTAGAPLLNLTGERSSKGGAATVQWDDEGVVPEEFPIVKDGVLVDFQTTRESAAWLKAFYGKHSIPVRSRGCAGSAHGVATTIQTPPNLKLLPSKETLDLADLIANVGNGLVLRGVSPGMRILASRNNAPVGGRMMISYANIDMDSQALNGFVLANKLPFDTARLTRIKNGKEVARIRSAVVMFRSPELWKGLLALGGEASVRSSGIRTTKGEPQQDAYYTVMAPPATFKQLTAIRD